MNARQTLSSFRQKLNDDSAAAERPIPAVRLAPPLPRTAAVEIHPTRPESSIAASTLLAKDRRRDFRLSSLQEILFDITCRLAEVKFEGIFDEVVDQNGCTLVPPQVCITDPQTGSSFSISAHEVIYEGAERIRKERDAHRQRWNRAEAK